MEVTLFRWIACELVRLFFFWVAVVETDRVRMEYCCAGEDIVS